MSHTINLRDDVRIKQTTPLPVPAELCAEIPLTERGAAVVTAGRLAVSQVVRGNDDRLLVVVGPCSIHDPVAALEYAHRLREIAGRLGDELLIVMRIYFEKPRTVVGWKGLINDPHLDGSGDVEAGLRLGRQVLADVTNLGLPAGCEFLDPIMPQYLADAVSWGAIGARTIESQVHRQMASGLSMPIGMKNRTDGDVQSAVDAISASSVPHTFVGVDHEGRAAVMTTVGNSDSHLVLRGGRGMPNYDAVSVEKALQLLGKIGVTERVIVDASHDNSGKDHARQSVVARALAEQMAGGAAGIAGVMLESFLVAGRQDIVAGQPLTYGQSVTDACMSWDTTVDTLEGLAIAVHSRRKALATGMRHSAPSPRLWRAEHATAVVK